MRKHTNNSGAPASGDAPARRALDPRSLADTLLEGQSIEVLQALGLVTPRGGASADANRKIKQIQHFIRQIAPTLDEVFERYREPVLFDAAAGKSYLAFVIFELYIKKHGRGRMIACDVRPDLAERVQNLAKQLHFEDRFEVLCGKIIDVPLPERIHFTLALHACDTATDEAWLRALKAKSDHIALVPCCQAEVSQLLKNCHDGPAALWGNAWHRREFGAHLTNVMRTLALQSCGYQVQVTELAGWEHSLKNELILAKRMGRYSKAGEEALEKLHSEIPVTPWFLTVLDQYRVPKEEPKASESAQ